MAVPFTYPGYDWTAWTEWEPVMKQFIALYTAHFSEQNIGTPARSYATESNSVFRYISNGVSDSRLTGTDVTGDIFWHRLYTIFCSPFFAGQYGTRAPEIGDALEDDASFNHRSWFFPSSFFIADAYDANRNNPTGRVNLLPVPKARKALPDDRAERVYTYSQWLADGTPETLFGAGCIVEPSMLADFIKIVSRLRFSAPFTHATTVAGISVLPDVLETLSPHFPKRLHLLWENGNTGARGVSVSDWTMDEVIPVVPPSAATAYYSLTVEYDFPYQGIDGDPRWAE